MRMSLGLGLSRRAASSGGGGNVAPVITGVPTISGTTGLGDVLTASPASVSGTPTPTRTWQWARNGLDISGETAITHTIVSADQGTNLTVRQIETNVAGSANATSLATSIPAAFTPADIFQASENGFWGEVTASELWQDTARTTPVTTDGQTVASWRLNTAAGVVYAEQATAGSRPTYRVSGGIEWLDFDGGDSLVTASTLANVANYQCFVAVRPSTVAAGTRQIVSQDLVSASRRRAQYLRIDAATPQTICFVGGTATSDSGATLTANVDTVLSGIAISGTSLDMRVAGSSNGTTAQSGTINTFTDAVTIGRNANSATEFFSGRLYGVILRSGPNLTAGEITNAEGWLTALQNP